jgi:hypothetical protein
MSCWTPDFDVIEPAGLTEYLKKLADRYQRASLRK